MTWIVVAAGVVVLWGIAAYNGLVRKRNQVRNGWSQIDVQLKRRHDLIPNLVSTVRGYLEHERGVFEQVTRAREQALAAGNDVPARSAAESGLTAAVRSLFARVESYPDLKANRNVLDLQEELRSTENRIGFARQFYNDAVMAFNTTLHSFPTNLLSSLFHFAPEPFFEADVSDRAAPRVTELSAASAARRSEGKEGI